MADCKCIIEINGNKAEFAIDEPKPYRMVCTELEVQRLVHERCYCPEAEVRYLGMLHWSIALDGCAVGNAIIRFEAEG